MGVLAKGDDQINFLAHSSGVPYERAKTHLRQLSDNHAIRYDQNIKRYMFWERAMTVDPNELIQRKITQLGLRPPSGAELTVQLKQLYTDKAATNFGSIPVEVAWGEMNDWAATEFLMTANELADKPLTELIQRTSISSKEGYIEGERGAVIWLLAQNDAELEEYKHLQGKLDSALPGDHPPAILLIKPASTHRPLFDTSMRLRALQNFTPDEREKVTNDAYKELLARAQADLLKGLETVRGAPEHITGLARETRYFIVPQAYRARVQALPRPTIRNAMTEIYKLAYRYAPPSFRTDWDANKKNLRTAVVSISGMMLQNNPAALKARIMTNPVEGDICNKFLVQSWQLLDGNYRIQQQVGGKIAEAWQHLDHTFPAGESIERKIQQALDTLLGPPFGYDFNTALLLFSAWAGYHSQDLQFVANGRSVSRETIVSWIGKGPKEFFKEACTTQFLALARKNPDELRKDVEEIIKQIQKGELEREPAGVAHSKLEEFLRNDRHSEADRDRVRQHADRLHDAIKQADAYKQFADKIQALTTQARKVSDLTTLLGTLQQAPQLGIVKAAAPKPDALRGQAVAKLQAFCEDDFRRLSHVPTLTDVGLYREHTRKSRQEVEKAGFPHLVAIYDRAMTAIDECEATLLRREQESGINQQINNLSLSGTLLELRQAQEFLRTLEGYSAETMANCNRKLAALTQTLEQLATQADELQQKARTVTTQTDLRALRDRILKSESRYVGSDLEATLTATHQRLEHTATYLTELAAVEKAIDPPQQLRTPQEEATLRQRMQDAIHHYQEAITNADPISAEQSALAARILRKLDAAADAERQRAANWLATRLELVKSRPDQKLLTDLENPHPFLPADKHVEVAALAIRVRESLESDIITRIEYQFRSLKSRAQRAKCLQQLQAILEQA